MAGKPSKPMTPFDKSVTPSYLYKWKLFLAFLPPSIQRFLAVYIKFAEFRYTMDHFRGLPFHAFSFQSISELAPYMDENERDMMNQMTSVMQMAEMMAMAQAGSTGGDPGASGPASPVDLMKTMMSGEDMEMFQNYMELFDEELSASGTPAKKGDSSHEWNNNSYNGLFRKQYRKQLDGSSGYEWNGSCQTGADPARRKTDRRQKRKITGSRDDGTHHQRKQKRNPVHSSGNVSHPRHSERGTPCQRTGAD